MQTEGSWHCADVLLCTRIQGVIAGEVFSLRTTDFNAGPSRRTNDEMKRRQALKLAEAMRIRREDGLWGSGERFVEELLTGRALGLRTTRS